MVGNSYFVYKQVNDLSNNMLTDGVYHSNFIKKCPIDVYNDMRSASEF